MKTQFALTCLVLFGLIWSPSKSQDFQLLKPAEPIQSLHKHRPNEVIIQLPTKMKWEDMTFQSEEAQISKQEKEGYLSIVPTKEKVEIRVFHKSKLVKTLTYQATLPIVQVRSAHVEALYRNCSNDVAFDIKENGNYYTNLTYQSADAQIIPREKYITIIPHSNVSHVAVEIYHNDQLIATETFKVREIPEPEIRLFRISPKEGIPHTFKGALDVRATPNGDFAAFLPKDARFRVTQYTVTLARENRAILTEKVEGSSRSLDKIMDHAESGDRLVVEIKKVERMNALDQVTRFEMPMEIFVIPVN